MKFRVRMPPFSRKTAAGNDTEYRLEIDRIPRPDSCRFCRRSSAQFSGSAWARQGFARSARRYRALEPARRAPEWLAITGATAKSTGQSGPHLQALSHRFSAITVLCLDESPLEPSRSFHDVLLPRLGLACTADGARVRSGVVHPFRIYVDGPCMRRRHLQTQVETKGGHRVFG